MLFIKISPRSRVQFCFPWLCLCFPWDGASHEAGWCGAAVLDLLESPLALGSLAVVQPMEPPYSGRLSEQGRTGLELLYQQVQILVPAVLFQVCLLEINYLK